MRTNQLRARARLLIAFAFVLTTACEGDRGPTGPQGPQGPEGAEGAQGPTGEDGNANVTVHIFDGHDFSQSFFVDLCMGEGIDAQETAESSWRAYLGLDSPDFGLLLFHVPGAGIGGDSEYLTVTAYDASAVNCSSPQSLTEIFLYEGPGEAYDEIRIIQIAADAVIDNRSSSSDVTDYHAVLAGFGGGVAVVRH
ncbi:MAG: hypothetical protein ACODAB_03310 [Gemmatimonadota bacterium]